MKYCLVILALVTCICACDPMKRINMRNEGSQDASIHFFIKEDSIHSSPLFLSNSKEVVFDLPRKGKTIRLSCGIGMWTPKEVHALIDDLDSIHIRTGPSILKLQSQGEMLSYLMPRRRGLDRGKINLHIGK